MPDYHSIANIFPLFENDDLQTLVSDIKQNGLLQPIELFEGRIIDGRNRYRACEIAGVKPRYITFTGTPEQAISKVWSLNIERRHLSSDQRACCDALRNKLLDSYRSVREAAKQRQVEYLKQGNKIPVRLQIDERESTPTTTLKVRAKAAGTNKDYISMADKLLVEQPEVFAQVQRGETRLSQLKRHKTSNTQPTYSIKDELCNLRKEIKRRREEAHAKRGLIRWNPAAVRTSELIILVNYIEDELNRLITLSSTLTTSLEEGQTQWQSDVSRLN